MAEYDTPERFKKPVQQMSSAELYDYRIWLHGEIDRLHKDKQSILKWGLRVWAAVCVVAILFAIGAIVLGCLE